jgi:ribosomal protein S25
MTDFLEEKRKEIQARLEELRPAVEEYHRLEAAERALAGVPANGNGTRGTGRAASAKPRSSRTRSDAAAGTGRRGRPKGSGQRAQQALEQIRNEPGITIPELAEKMGIKQNYLYRVVPDLQEQGLVTKSGRGWHIRQ